jgi:hypothetical protein
MNGFGTFFPDKACAAILQRVGGGCARRHDPSTVTRSRFSALPSAEKAERKIRHCPSRVGRKTNIHGVTDSQAADKKHGARSEMLVPQTETPYTGPILPSAVTMARPCKPCIHADQEAVRSALTSGITDRARAKQFGLSHVCVGRHRREHVVRPMQVAAAALDKARGIRDQREQLALSSIIADLRTVHERLERQADAAEQDNQRLAVASLSAQQLRAAEVRAKIGGLVAPPRRRQTDRAMGCRLRSTSTSRAEGKSRSR